jgi:hypothetical protein
MLQRILIVCCTLPLIARAQELPYPMVFALQRAADSAAKVDGVVCRLKMQHAREGDTRPFKVILESPHGRTAVKISPDGSFNLPTLPEEDRNRSKLVHDLEKGALAITFGFQIGGVIREDIQHEKTVFQVCSEVAKGLQKLDEMWNMLGQFQPQFKDLELAIVGLSLPRAAPARGRVLLKRGDVTARTVDLSQTGEIAFMFDQYNPREHTIAWEMEKDEPNPPVEFVFKSGPDAQRVKDAIYIRKVEPGAAPNSR